MQGILSELVKDLGRDPGNAPLDVATGMDFLRHDGAALSILQEQHIWRMNEIAKNNYLLALRFVPGRFERRARLYSHGEPDWPES